MKIDLINHTPLAVAVLAVNKCYNQQSDSEYWEHVDTGIRKFRIGDKDSKRLLNCIKKDHTSVLEHLTYTFNIDGISRVCLQQLARHRHASFSVKSTRYTLQELKDVTFSDLDDYLVESGNEAINWNNKLQLSEIAIALNNGTPNDVAKYSIPEAFKTSLVFTINARSLRNLLTVRLSKTALKEFQVLAGEMYLELPSDHEFLFSDIIQNTDIAGVSYSMDNIPEEYLEN